MGASDYMVDTTAPYRALASTPNYAQMLMQGIGSLGDSYFKGTQQANTLAQQNAFKGGLPTRDGQPLRPDGSNIDSASILNTGAQLGGLPYVQGLQKFLLQQPATANLNSAMGGQPGVPPMNGGGAPAPAQGAPQPGPMVQPITNPGSGNAPTSLMDIVTGAYPADKAGDVSARLARRFGIKDETAPLQPEQIQQIARAVGPDKLQSQGKPTPDFNGQPASAANDTAQQGASGNQPPLPPGWSQQAADKLRGDGNAILQAATNPNLTPEQANIAKASAEARFDLAKRMEEAIAKRSEMTGEQKNARDPTILRTEARKEEQKGEIAQSQKTYNGMQAAAAQYERDLKPYLTMSRSILSTPGIYTGIGGNLSLDINKVRSLFGDSKAATLQAALQKVTATSVLDQINLQRDQLMEAGGTSSRIFAQQVDLVQKAAPTLENTVEGNRFLVEVASRMGELHSQVASMARDYIQQNGHLDAGFDKQLSAYIKAHPVFNAQEQEHPELLGAPALPPNVAGKQAVAAWGKGLGLKSGDPIRTPDGRVVAMP